MRRTRRWAAGDFFERFGPRRRRPNPLAVPWRWRREIAAAVGVPWGVHALVAATNPVAATCVVAATVIGLVWWTPGWRFLLDRARAVLVEHRLRVGMVQCHVYSWSGWLPAILRATPTERGVRVVLWCPAGVDVLAFHSSRSALAAACWAADVEVARHPRWAHLVVLLVVTRPDPPRG